MDRALADRRLLKSGEWGTAEGTASPVARPDFNRRLRSDRGDRSRLTEGQFSTVK